MEPPIQTAIAQRPSAMAPNEAGDFQSQRLGAASSMSRRKISAGRMSEIDRSGGIVNRSAVNIPARIPWMRGAQDTIRLTSTSKYATRKRGNTAWIPKPRTTPARLPANPSNSACAR